MADLAGTRLRLRAGFTLVELLVVIAIIAMLAGLTVVGVQRSRQTARGVVCTSNLRQWGLAVNNYAATHDGYLPRRGQGQRVTEIFDRPEDWFNALPPRVEQRPLSELVARGVAPKPGDTSIWMCPEAQPTDQVPFFAYGMNMALSVWDQQFPDMLDKVGSPRSLVFLAEGPGNYCSVLPSNQIFSPVPRHQDRVNICFLDGHVGFYDATYVGCGTGDPQRIDLVWRPEGSDWKFPGQPKVSHK